MLKKYAHFFRGYYKGFNQPPKGFKALNPLIFSSIKNEGFRENAVLMHEGFLDYERRLIEPIKELLQKKNMNFYLIRFGGILEDFSFNETIGAELSFDYGCRWSGMATNGVSKLIQIGEVEGGDLNCLNHLFRKIARIKIRVQNRVFNSRRGS